MSSYIILASTTLLLADGGI